MKPKVSILCITFNQRKFIRQAIDSFLMQKTDFEFEILIHDDKSTDGTMEIIKEYEKAYPDIIRPFYEKKNQYSQANYSFITDLYVRARGQYIAFCEGDDYWINIHKLQKQVDFLDKHPDYALCFHPAKVVFENHEERDTLFPDSMDKKEFNLERLLRANFMQTSSVVYRNVGHYDTMASDPVPGDWYAHLFHAAHGKIGFLPTVMSVYRRHDGGVWWESRNGGEVDELQKRHGVSHLRLYMELLGMYGDNLVYKDIIEDYAVKTITTLADIDSRYNTELLRTYVNRFPEQGGEVLLILARIIKTEREVSEEASKRQAEKLEDLNQSLAKASSAVRVLQEDKERIINSTTYKLARRLSRVWQAVKGK